MENRALLEGLADDERLRRRRDVFPLVGMGYRPREMVDRGVGRAQ
jgi:hypothetical protein